MENKLKPLLKRFWKVDRFRPLQEEICTHLLSGDDALALLPTGGGKSLCYQLPSLLLQGPVLVLSPLLSLIHDQVLQANQRGIKSMAFDNKQSLDKQLDNAAFGKYKLLYITPEKAQNILFQQRIHELNIGLIAVDEAHCISQWGNDFRPAFLKIERLRELLPNTPLLALTATATQNVIKDIQRVLRLENTKIFRSSFIRKNIAIAVVRTEDKMGDLLRIFAQTKEGGIVYVNQRSTTEEVARFLKHNGFSAAFYHGGLSATEKADRVRAWQEEPDQIMVATSAFGMGMDKSNIRTVIHLHLPPSIEDYYQEIGRAGRDGQSAKATLLYAANDAARAKRLYIDRFPNEEFIKTCYKHLCNYLNIAHGEGTDQSWQLSFSTFCQRYQLPPKQVDQCWQLFDQYGIFYRAQKSQYRADIQINISPKKWQYALEHTSHSAALLMAALIRKYPGIFDFSIAVDLNAMAQKTGLEFSAVLHYLQQWEQQEMIDFHYTQYDTELTGGVPREEPYVLRDLLRERKQLAQVKTEKVKAMIAFAQQETRCRQQLILTYFGEKSTRVCGACNATSCAQENRPNRKEVVLQIKKKLGQNPMSAQELKLSLPTVDPTILAEALFKMIEEGVIEKNAFEKYLIK